MLGHNEPPTGTDAITLRLDETHADLIRRRDELLASCERMPEAVDSEELAGMFTEQARILSVCIKAATAAHKAEKEPYLQGGRTIDGYFKRGIAEPLDAAKKDVLERLNDYQTQKREAERKARLEAEAAAKAEADRLAAEAADDAGLEDAIDAEQRAQEAAAAAQASNAELSRTHSDLGAVASQTSRWVGEIADLEALDLEALRPHLSQDALQKALNSFVRAGGRQLRGAVIKEKFETRVR